MESFIDAGRISLSETGDSICACLVRVIVGFLVDGKHSSRDYISNLKLHSTKYKFLSFSCTMCLFKTEYRQCTKECLFLEFYCCIKNQESLLSSSFCRRCGILLILHLNMALSSVQQMVSYTASACFVEKIIHKALCVVAILSISLVLLSHLNQSLC